MRARDSTLTVRGRDNVLFDTNVVAWVKCCLHCGRRGMALSRCVGFEFDLPFACGYQEVEYEKDVSKLVQSLDGHLLPETGPSLVFSPRLHIHLSFAERFHSWVRDCIFEPRLRRHVRGIFARWYFVELLVIPLLNRLSS